MVYVKGKVTKHGNGRKYVEIKWAIRDNIEAGEFLYLTTKKVEF